MHIPLIYTVLGFFNSIKELVGRKVYLFVFINIALGFMEGIGLALMIPLFFIFQDDRNADKSEWVIAVKKVFEYCSIQYSNELFLVLVVCLFLVSRLIALLSYKIDAFLFAHAQGIIYHKILKGFRSMSFQYFSHRDPGYFNNLLQNETTRAISAIHYYVKALNHLILAVVLFFIALSSNFAFTFAIVGFTGFVILIFSRISKKTKKLSYEYSNINSRFQSLSIEYLNNFKYLISTNTFSNFVPRLFQCSDEVIENKYKIKFLTDSLTVYTMMVLFPSIAAIIYIFIKVIGFPIEGVLVSLIVSQRALNKALNFQNVWQLFNNVSGSYKYFMKGVAEINDHFETSGQQKVKFEQIEIRFCNVYFSYNQDFELYLPELTFSIKSITSLVGTSGAGKTSILDLILRIYTPQQGEILINDVNYANIDLCDFRNHIGVVNQENSLFNDSIFNNISRWGEDTTESREKAKQVCILANIDEFIQTLDQGYDTVIGDKGVRLSGGQRQRISIARELYKNPSLLVLDEATSALDSESEAKIKETIDNLRGKMTIVIVAHRLSTVRNSDKIIVLEKGKVIQSGTFNELLSVENSRFRELVNSQLIQE